MKLLFGITTLLMLAGCANNVHFVNTPVPPLPNVLPDPQEFKLAYSVQNDTKQVYPVHALQVKVFASYRTNFTSQNCQTTQIFKLRRIEPGEKVVATSVKFEKNDFAGDPCRCFQGACEGYITLSLTNAAGVLIDGPKTKFQITWEKSGSLADLSVVDQSD